MKIYGHCDHCGACWVVDDSVHAACCRECGHAGTVLYDAPPCRVIHGASVVTMYCGVCARSAEERP